MWRILRLASKHLTIAIPLIMILGFLYGVKAPTAFLKQWIIPFTFLMVYPMMVTLNIKKVFEGGDIKAQLLTQALNFGLVPFIAYYLGVTFFPDQPYMALGMLLAGLVPTSGMTISWTGFARGNIAAAVKMTVIGLIIGSLATPFYVKWLMGAELEVNMAAVMKQIVVIVFIPMAAGYLTRSALIRKYGPSEFQSRWAPRFPALSVLGVLGIVFIAIALKASAIYTAPRMMLYILIPLGIIYTLNYFLSTMTGRLLLPRGDAIALVYGSVMRNLSIALAIAINAFGPEGSSTALVIAVAYIIQVQSAAWYVKFTDKIYGPPEAPSPSAETPDAAPAPEPASPVPDSAKESPAITAVADIQRILFATDLSESARNAARHACSIAWKYGAAVTLLHVVADIMEEYNAGMDLSDRMAPAERKGVNREEVAAAMKRIEKRVAEVSQTVKREIPRCPVEEGDIRVEAGDPAAVIVRVAKEGKYDLVVMGTGGHAGLARLTGSVSEAVVKQSPCPVLTVGI